MVHHSTQLLLRIYLWRSYFIPLVLNAYVAVPPETLDNIRERHHYTIAGGGSYSPKCFRPLFGDHVH